MAVHIQVGVDFVSPAGCHPFGVLCPCMSLSQQRAQIRWNNSDIRMVLRCTVPLAAFDRGGKHFSVQQIGRSKTHLVPHNHLHFAFVSCTPVSKLDTICQTLITLTIAHPSVS